MKTSITLPSLAPKCFNSLKDKNDEPVYTYNDEYMRYFVRQSRKKNAVRLSANKINPSIRMKYLLIFQNN